MAPGSNANEPVQMNKINETLDYVQHGYMTFRSNNFGAHIELENSVRASAVLTNYTAPLPTVPITPFQVCGSQFNSVACITNTKHRYRVLQA